MEWVGAGEQAVVGWAPRSLHLSRQASHHKELRVQSSAWMGARPVTGFHFQDATARRKGCLASCRDDTSS